MKPSDNRGITFIELLLAMGILALLVHMSAVSYFDYKQSAFNTRALSDGRNLATVISNSLVDDEDIDYTHAPGDGNAIGARDNDGNPRKQLFGLSEGVAARIIGNSEFFAGGQGYMEAYIYHENGSYDPLTPSNKREYLCLVDELAGVIAFSID